MDQSGFPWDDGGWAGFDLATAIIYEMHVGTFSEEGTFDGAIEHLDHLVDLGVTVVEDRASSSASLRIWEIRSLTSSCAGLAPSACWRAVARSRLSSSPSSRARASRCSRSGSGCGSGR